MIVVPYRPRPQQVEVHDALESHRWGVITCHRRFGKTVLAINHLLRDAMICTLERPRYAYIAPLLKQAKAISWDYLKHFASAIPSVTFNESELRCDLPNGGRISLYGADNPDALRGIYLDGVVMDEVANMPAKLWGEIIRPTLSDREGWGLFIGTPQGRNFFYQLYTDAQAVDNWYADTYRASETGIIPESELEDLRKVMTEDEYNQEYECDWAAAAQGAYYAKLIEKARKENRITSVPYDSFIPVDTWWDLGVGDATTIWFTQAVGKEIRVIDYYEAEGEGLQHYANVLSERGYNYRDHNAPHDIKVRELGSGRSRLETAYGFGINFNVVPNIPVDDGINAVRGILSRCWFDAEKTRSGVDALVNYRKDYDQKNRTFKARPLHDWSSHASDAFRYFAVGFLDYDSAQEVRVVTTL